MAVLSDITLLVAPPPPKRETVTLDMSNLRYAVVGNHNVVCAVFGIRPSAVAYYERNPQLVGLRIIDLTNGNDVTVGI